MKYITCDSSNIFPHSIYTLLSLLWTGSLTAVVFISLCARTFLCFSLPLYFLLISNISASFCNIILFLHIVENTRRHFLTHHYYSLFSSCMCIFFPSDWTVHTLTIRVIFIHNLSHNGCIFHLVHNTLPVFVCCLSACIFSPLFWYFLFSCAFVTTLHSLSPPFFFVTLSSL